MIKMKNLAHHWLRWSEKYLKTDTIYLVRSGFWLSLGYGFAMFSGFFVSLAFANLFPKESFGTYKFIISAAGIVGVFSLTQMGTAVTQAVARGFGNALRQGFRANLKWSVGILLAGIILGLYYYLNKNFVLAFSFLLMGVLAPISSSARLYSSYLQGKKDFKKSSFYGTINNIVPAAALILALLLTKNLLVIMVVYFVFGAFVPLLLYRATIKAYREENKIEDPELTSYSGHLSAMETISSIANYLDKILIFHYLGAAPLAIYAFAIAPVEQLQGGKKILATLVLPKISGRSFEELQQTTPRKTLLLTLYALALAGVYILLAPYFYKFLFPQYLDSVLYSQIYSLTLLAISGTLFNETLVAHKKKQELYLYRTIVPIFKILLFFLLLPIFGLMGLIVTHVVTRLFSAGLAYYFVKYPFKS